MPLEVAPFSASPISTEFLNDAETLIAAFASLARTYPDFECLAILERDGDRRISLGSLWQRAQRIRTFLKQRGIGPDRSVLIILPTGSELVSAYFGVMLAGNVPAVVAGPTHRISDHTTYVTLIRTLLSQADAPAVYCDAEIAAILSAALGSSKTIMTPADISDEPVEEITVLPDPDAIATMQFSSGSTGIPKGVLLSHRAILNNIRAIRDGLGVKSSDISVNWIPLYHDMGLIDAFLLPLLSGCSTVLMPTTDFMKDPTRWLWAIHAYRGTISWSPNFAYTVCANIHRIPSDQLTGLDLSSWRIAINAAEPVLHETMQAFTARFSAYGFQSRAMTPAWGLAENVTLATCHPIDDVARVETIDRDVLTRDALAQPTSGSGLHSVAIGRCLPRCSIEVRSSTGAALRDREVGMIWLSSDCLFSGYHRDPELTASVLVNGWLNTGDRGYVTDGDLFFVSREKDLIVIGGEKYAPHYIETVINQVPGVRAGCAVVFGVLNKERGTEDVASVVETREEDQRAREALESAIRLETMRATGLALRYVILVPPGGVQKTTSGKLARAATRRRWAAHLDVEPAVGV